MTCSITNCMLTLKLSWLRQELCMGANYEVCTRHMGWHFLFYATWKKPFKDFVRKMYGKELVFDANQIRYWVPLTIMNVCYSTTGQTYVQFITYPLSVGLVKYIPKSTEKLTRGSVQTSFAHMQLWEIPLPKMQFKLRWASAIDQRGHHIRLHLFDKYAGLVP